MVDYHPDVPRDFTDMVNGYESTIKRLRAENERLDGALHAVYEELKQTRNPDTAMLCRVIERAWGQKPKPAAQ